jgi:hypothetical protein
MVLYLLPLVGDDGTAGGRSAGSPKPIISSAPRLKERR